MTKVGVVSLGCDKNRIDTENMLAMLVNRGYEFTGNPEEAEVIVVNTCAFIDSAKSEAIDTVLEMSEYKTRGACKCLVVTGCLPQRYMDEVIEGLPEVDVFLGTANYEQLADILDSFQGEQIALCNDKDKRYFTKERVLTTPYHYAYLKIAEGCDNKCTYCAIPSIRGRYTSRPIEDIVEEARELIKKYQVQELILVAQDVTKYGKDLYGDYKLICLLDKLQELDIEWIRLLYCYPELVSDRLIEYVAKSPKIVKYLDIPMQHAADAVLKRMGRRVNKELLIDMLNKIRAAGDITVRSTFIVGFPGETEEQYEELYSFIEEMRLDRCGFFAYSKEDGTPAARLKEQVPQRVKKARVRKLYALQERIMAERAAEKVGSVMTAIYEDVDYDNNRFILRSSQDAPEIDSVIYATSVKPLDIGNIYRVKITGTDGLDLIGEVL